MQADFSNFSTLKRIRIKNHIADSNPRFMAGCWQLCKPRAEVATLRILRDSVHGKTAVTVDVVAVDWYTSPAWQHHWTMGGFVSVINLRVTQDLGIRFRMKFTPTFQSLPRCPPARKNLRRHRWAWQVQRLTSMLKLMKLKIQEDTVDGRNPAPVEGKVVEIPLFTGFYTSQVVGLGISEPSTVPWDFGHCSCWNPWMSIMVRDWGGLFEIKGARGVYHLFCIWYHNMV